jgi:hypothetical protein
VSGRCSQYITLLLGVRVASEVHDGLGCPQAVVF